MIRDMDKIKIEKEMEDGEQHQHLQLLLSGYINFCRYLGVFIFSWPRPNFVSWHAHLNIPCLILCSAWRSRVF